MSIHPTMQQFIEDAHLVATKSASGFGFDAENTRVMQLKAMGGEGLVKGMGGMQSADGSHLEEENEEKKRERLSRMIGRAISNISQAVFDDLSNFVDEKIVALRRELTGVGQEIETVKAEIVKAETDLGVARDEEHVASRRAFQSADELSMLRYEEMQKRQLLEEQRLAMREARLSGDPEQIDLTRKAFKTTIGELRDLEKRILEGIDVSEQDAEKLRRAQERTQFREARLEDLKTNLGRLENDQANLKGKLAEYEAFRENLDSPEIQEKLNNGTLTLEDLKKAGMPEEALTHLEGKELNSKNVNRATYGGIIDIQHDTEAALKAEDKSYLDTAYDSAYDAMSAAYESISDGVSYVANGVSNFASGIYGSLTGEPDPATATRTGVSATHALEGAAIKATPPSTMKAFASAHDGPVGTTLPTQDYVQRPAPAMAIGAP